MFITKLDRFMGLQKKGIKKSIRRPNLGQRFKRPSKSQVCGETRHSVAVVTEMNRQVVARGWYIDSGATVHVCDSVDKFLSYWPVRDGKKVVVANGKKAEVIGMGMVSLCFATGEDLTLSNVLHVPSIHKCLISVSKLDLRKYEVTFRRRKAIFRKRMKIVGKGYFQGGMYRLDLNSDYEHGCPYPIDNSTTDESDSSDSALSD